MHFRAFYKYVSWTEGNSNTDSLGPTRCPPRSGEDAGWGLGARPPPILPGACGWGPTVSLQGCGKSQGLPWKQLGSHGGFSRSCWAAGRALGLKAQGHVLLEAGQTIHSFLLLLWMLLCAWGLEARLGGGQNRGQGAWTAVRRLVLGRPGALGWAGPARLGVRSPDLVPGVKGAHQWV